MFNFCFFNRCIKKRKFFKIINIWQNCHTYTLQIINLEKIVNTNNKKHNEKWPYIADHSYRILIIGGSGSGKTNTLLNLISEQEDIDKIYLHAKDLSESKYEYLTRNRQNAGIEHLNDSKAFIEYSNTMDNGMKILIITIQTEKKN